MDDSNKGRIIAAVLAIFLGVGGVFTLVRFVQTSEERALAGQELVEVYIVSDAIQAGTPAKELESSVEKRKIPANIKADGSIVDLSKLGELVTSVDLVAGEQLVQSRFSASLSRTVAGGQVPVPDGLLEATIQINPERAVGGQIEPGDKISLLVSIDIDQNGQTVPATKTLLTSVLVTNIQTGGALALPDTAINPGQEEDRIRQTPASDLLFTVAVEPEQLQRIIFAKEYGSIWLASEPALLAETDLDLITLQTLFEDIALSSPTEPSIDEADDSDDGSSQPAADRQEQ